VVYVLTAVVLVAVTAYLTGIVLFGAAPVTAPTGGGTLAAPSPVAAAATSLSGTAVTPAGLVLRIVGAVAFIAVSMLGVGAIALFLSTLTNSPLAAALGALAALITSQVLVTLNSADAVAPYLPTRYWLAWIDFFREPVLWRDIERGAGIQLVYLVVLLGAAWANFLTKDVAN
jgi:ABC-2 type transport system permease protein